MADPIISVAELAIWARIEIASDDAFALAIIDAASEVVRQAANQPFWDSFEAPPRARQITAHLAARSYNNPDSVTRSGVGPLSESTAESVAIALHLTAAEKGELAILGGGAVDGGAGAGGGGLWVQPLADQTPVVYEDTIYLADSSGTLLAYYEPGAVGSPE